MRYIRTISILLAVILVLPLFVITGSTASVSPEDKDRFISVVGEMAREDMRKNGILASFTIAQAIHETGWGTSNLAVRGNNLFGIKAYNTWKGRVYCRANQTIYNSLEEAEEIIGSALFNTEEYKNNFFRVYSSWQESVDDHSLLLNTNDRYVKLRGLTDYRLAALYIVESGYCDNPEYTDTIINYIETYELYRYDTIGSDGPVNSVEIGADNISLEIGKSVTLKPQITPSNATGFTLKYDTSNSTAVQVSQTGVVTAVSTGRAAITVTAGSQTDTLVVYAHAPGVTLYTGVTTGAVNCRREPSSAGGSKTVIGSFSKNTQLVLFGSPTSDGWYLVNGRGEAGVWITGYTHQSYINLTGNFVSDTLPDVTDPPDPILPSSYQMGVTTGTLNQRKGPGTDNPVTGSFAKGTKILLIGEPVNGWYKCVGVSETGKIIEGYSGASYINVAGGFLATTGLTLTETDGYITSIPAGKTVKNLKDALKHADVEVYSKQNILLSDSSKLANGCTLKFNWCGKTYVTKTLLVSGDVDCDGNLSALDYISVRLHILGITPLTGVALKAACVTGSSAPGVMDYISIRLKLLGLK